MQKLSLSYYTHYITYVCVISFVQMRNRLKRDKSEIRLLHNSGTLSAQEIFLSHISAQQVD